MDLDTEYEYAVEFFREKNNKAFHITYEETNTMIALTNQIKYGQFDAVKFAPTGLFDFIGRDRRNSWILLKDMSKEHAQTLFIDKIKQFCPEFYGCLEAYQQSLKDREEAQQRTKEIELQLQQQQQLQKQQQQAENEVKSVESLTNSLVEETQKRIAQENKIRAALNKQTLPQFLQYAKQLHPDDPHSQEKLISKLQQTHFHKYMLELYSHYPDHISKMFENDASNAPPADESAQRREDGEKSDQSQSPNADDNPPQSYKNNNKTELDDNNNGSIAQSIANHVAEDRNAGTLNDNSVQSPSSSSHNDHQSFEQLRGEEQQVEENKKALPNAENADEIENAETKANSPSNSATVSKNVVELWTHSNIVEFKSSLENDNDGMLKIGSGEIVTIRVPTHHEGSYLSWEFASDSLDIGFGLMFEWSSGGGADLINSANTTEQSCDEKTMAQVSKTPLPAGATSTSKSDVNSETSPNEQLREMIEILPITRKNSHEEVQCGRHAYPGFGMYLLRFDNSYSLWRSKSIYYRVYYTC